MNGIGLVGARVDGEAGRGRVAQRRRFEVRRAQAERGVAGRGPERAGREVVVGRDLGLAGRPRAGAEDADARRRRPAPSASATAPTAARHGRRRRRPPPGRSHHGEELGTADVALGDDAEKDGENVWISRISIDLVWREAQPVSSSETTARRTSSEHRKVGAREARREAARRNGGKPRERCKAGSREGSEPRKGSVTGVGWRIRTADGPWCVTVASLEPPGPARAGVVRHDPGAVPAGHRRRGPEEHGRLRPNGYSGLRRVRAPVRRGSDSPCTGNAGRRRHPRALAARRGRVRRASAHGGPRPAGRSPAATWRFSSAWTRARSSGWVTPTQRPAPGGP